MTPADVAAAYADVTRGEASLTVASMARDSGDARFLLEVLGLTGTSWRWSLPRAAAAIVAAGRSGARISMNTLRYRFPDRAVALIPAALRELQGAGMIAPTGQLPVSLAPGAKGRRVREYVLTDRGERTAREIAPWPGEDSPPCTGPSGVLEMGSLP